MDRLKNRSLLVVGGTGFIGTNLLKKANDLGMLTTSLSLNNPPKINELTKTNYVVADTSNFENLKRIFLNKKFDYVVNLGSYINHSSISNGGFELINSQLHLLNNLVTIFSCKSLKRFVQIGSSDEYGFNKSPQLESKREDPISPYSLAKVINTHLLTMLKKTENFPVVILRLFLVYGPYQKTDRLIPYVIKSCINNQTFTLSDGEQIKDFTYVDVIIDHILLSLVRSNLEGEIINIGSGAPISVREIVEKICDKIKKGKPIFSSKYNKNIENISLFPKLTKSTKLLNSKKRVTLDIGLQTTINWYIKHKLYF